MSCRGFKALDIIFERGYAHNHGHGFVIFCLWGPTLLQSSLGSASSFAVQEGFAPATHRGWLNTITVLIASGKAYKEQAEAGRHVHVQLIAEGPHPQCMATTTPTCAINSRTCRLCRVGWQRPGVSPGFQGRTVAAGLLPTLDDGLLQGLQGWQGGCGGPLTPQTPLPQGCGLALLCLLGGL